MGLAVFQNNFLGGELSQSMYARLDDIAFKGGAAKLENFFVRPTGLAEKRQGSKFVWDTNTNQNVRLIPFRFSSEQTLVLVFTHKRMYISTQGKMVMSGSSPYSVETPYTSEELFELEYSQNADIVTITHRQHPPFELKRYGATDWRFEECKFAPLSSASADSG